jgi:hypothetical protein
MKYKLHGCDKFIWFGVDYDLRTDDLDVCGYSALDGGNYDHKPDDTIIFIDLSTLRRGYANPDYKEWMQDHDVQFYKFTPITNKCHLFGQSTYGMIFRNEEDAVMYRMMW